MFKYFIWFVFGLIELDMMEINDDGFDYVVGILFVFFLIILVVMLVNILIVLFINIYNKVEVKNFCFCICFLFIYFSL